MLLKGSLSEPDWLSEAHPLSDEARIAKQEQNPREC